METYRLICHPDTPQSALSGVEVVLERRGVCCLSLSFRALGSVGEIAWPGGRILLLEDTGSAPGFECLEADATAPIESVRVAGAAVHITAR